jgi:hypothetical protein
VVAFVVWDIHFFRSLVLVVMRFLSFLGALLAMSWTLAHLVAVGQLDLLATGEQVEIQTLMAKVRHQTAGQAVAAVRQRSLAV